MSDQLRILEALGDELERATAADERTHGARRRRRWRPHGLSLVLLIGGLSAATVAAAATHLFGLAAPVPAPRPGDAPVEARPIASTASLAGVRSGDPGGLPDWEVRLSRSQTGQVCTAVGQLQDGRFGIVGLDRKFRELPLGSADACGSAPVGSAVQVGARAAVGRGDMTARTLVVGIAGPDVTSVALRRGTRDTPLRLGRGGAFLAVLTGLPEITRPNLQITNSSGAVRTVKLADSGDEETPDSAKDGLPWSIRSGPARNFVHPMAPNAVAPKAGTHCVEARQQLGSANLVYLAGGTGLAEPRTPIACRRAGQTDPIVATLLRLVPSTDFTEPYSYPVAPARTIAMGLASEDVVRLELRTPTGAVPVRVSPDSHAFAAVLDGRVDPARLELRARLRSGGLVTLDVENAVMLGADGRLRRPGPNPAWRDVREVIRANTQRFTREINAGSERTGPSAKDPAGGPPWAARTWTATTNRPGGSGTALQCAVFGPLVNGVVRQPSGAGVGPGPATEGLFGQSSGCTVSDLSVVKPPGRPIFYGAAPTIYVDDPTSATPKIARVTLTGVYPGVVAAEALGLPKGKQVPATVGPRGAVLAMLGPEAAEPGTNLSLRLHFRDGKTVKTDYSVFSPPKRRIEARAVDPKGGPAWGVRAWALREPRIPTSPGQLVDGRPGGLNDRTGEVIYASGVSGGATVPPTTNDPVWFEQALHPDETPSNEPAPADVARRTLPGRTVIYGAAAPGVTRVTIQTSRDVRTVRPSKPGGFFVVVYDGRFTQGRIRVIARGPGIYGVAQQRADGQPEGAPPQDGLGRRLARR